MVVEHKVVDKVFNKILYLLNVGTTQILRIKSFQEFEFPASKNLHHLDNSKLMDKKGL